MGERLPYKQDVTGSSPVIPTTFAGVAQLVEHCLAKAVVAGPSPVSRSIKTVSNGLFYLFFLFRVLKY